MTKKLACQGVHDTSDRSMDYRDIGTRFVWRSASQRAQSSTTIFSKALRISQKQHFQGPLNLSRRAGTAGWMYASALQSWASYLRTTVTLHCSFKLQALSGLMVWTLKWGLGHGLSSPPAQSFATTVLQQSLEVSPLHTSESRSLPCFAFS